MSENKERIINWREKKKLRMDGKYLQPSAGKVVGGMEPHCVLAGAFEGGGR